MPNNGCHQFKRNVDALYEYMRVLASCLVNSLIVPLDKLRKILIKVKQNVRTNPYLEVPDDPHKNDWAYYPIMHITHIVVDDILLIILTIPLIDKSLQMDLYKVHNLPALHPELGVQFSYVI